MVSVSELLRTGGILEIATDYDVFADSQACPDGTNNDAGATFYDSTYTYERLAYFQNFNVTHTNEDEQETSFDDCDLQSNITSRLTPSFNFDLFGVNNIDNMARILGASVENVAGTPVVGATQDVVNPSAFLQFILIANQNGDGSAVSVTTVVGSVDGALVAGTDYDVVQDASGKYGIQLISGGAITTLTQTFTITYDYTPNASRVLGYCSQAKAKPFQLLRFVSCVDTFEEGGVTKNKVNYVYLTAAFLNSDYTENFVDLANGELTAASLTFTGDKNSKYYHRQEIVNA